MLKNRLQYQTMLTIKYVSIKIITFFVMAYFDCAQRNAIRKLDENMKCCSVFDFKSIFTRFHDNCFRCKRVDIYIKFHLRISAFQLLPYGRFINCGARVIFGTKKTFLFPILCLTDVKHTESITHEVIIVNSIINR